MNLLEAGDTFDYGVARVRVVISILGWASFSEESGVYSTSG